MKRLHKIFIGAFLIASCCSFGQSAAGLVAKYSFNAGNANNDLTSKSAKTVGVGFGEDRFGNPESACYLYGNNRSYLNLGINPTLKPRNGSISIWIKMLAEDYAGQGYGLNPIILTKNREGNDFFEAYSIGYGLQNKKICTCCSESEMNQIAVYGNQDLVLGKWHHIVITFNDQSLCLYCDGKLQSCAEKNFPTQFLTTDSVMVGNSANTKNSRFFAGFVDDIAIYNRVLSAQEVSDLYNEADPSRAHIIIKIVLMVFVSLAVLFVLVLLLTRKFKRALEKEREKNRLQRMMFEMEMKVIKAQMNPHFIFNSMNSIQQFILANDTENANTYLVKFARLLRKILESSTDEYISVENEVDILHKYIEMESLRFEHEMNYEIVTDEQLKGSNIKIPQMLIQPFVENAIWHGLRIKKGVKKLNIEFKYLNKRLLYCTIDDNGVGRNTNKIQEEVVSKKKSLGISFTHQRLELMRKEWEGEYGFEIIDKLDQQGNSNGTCVKIRIPIINN